MTTPADQLSDVDLINRSLCDTIRSLEEKLGCEHRQRNCIAERHAALLLDLQDERTKRTLAEATVARLEEELARAKSPNGTRTEALTGSPACECFHCQHCPELGCLVCKDHSHIPITRSAPTPFPEPDPAARERLERRFNIDAGRSKAQSEALASSPMVEAGK